MEWEQDISMFDWFFTPNNTSSKVIAITIGTIKYCYNIINLLINPTIGLKLKPISWLMQILQSIRHHSLIDFIACRFGASKQLKKSI